MENLINNKSHEKQIIILMIPNGEELNYLEIKKTIRIIKRNNVKIQNSYVIFIV